MLPHSCVDCHDAFPFPFLSVGVAVHDGGVVKSLVRDVDLEGS